MTHPTDTPTAALGTFWRELVSQMPIVMLARSLRDVMPARSRAPYAVASALRG